MLTLLSLCSLSHSPYSSVLPNFVRLAISPLSLALLTNFVRLDVRLALSISPLSLHVRCSFATLFAVRSLLCSLFVRYFVRCSFATLFAVRSLLCFPFALLTLLCSTYVRRSPCSLTHFALLSLLSLSILTLFALTFALLSRSLLSLSLTNFVRLALSALFAVRSLLCSLFVRYFVSRCEFALTFAALSRSLLSLCSLSHRRSPCSLSISPTFALLSLDLELSRQFDVRLAHSRRSPCSLCFVRRTFDVRLAHSLTSPCSLCFVRRTFDVRLAHSLTSPCSLCSLSRY